MKKFLTLLATTCALFWSCTEKEDLLESVEIEVSAEEVVFDSKSGSQTLTITSNCEFSLAVEGGGG